MDFIARLLGTFFFTGYFPVAPATFASAVFVLIYAIVPGGELLAHPIVAVTTLILSIPIATRLEKRYGHDASAIVIDEVVGMQMTLVWAAPTWQGLIAAFFVFRVFDILKPPPVGRAQSLPRGYGVVMDDLLAGLYSRVLLVLVSLVFSGIGQFR